MRQKDKSVNLKSSVSSWDDDLIRARFNSVLGKEVNYEAHFSSESFPILMFWIERSSRLEQEVRGLLHHLCFIDSLWFWSGDLVWSSIMGKNWLSVRESEGPAWIMLVKYTAYSSPTSFINQLHSAASILISSLLNFLNFFLGGLKDLFYSLTQ